MKTIFIVALAILFGFSFIQLGLESIVPVWHSGIANQATLVILLIMIGVWLFGWLGWDAYESEEVDKNLGKLITSGHRLAGYFIGIFIAVAFAAMVGSLGNLSLFIPLMASVVLSSSI